MPAQLCAATGGTFGWGKKVLGAIVGGEEELPPDDVLDGIGRAGVRRPIC